MRITLGQGSGMPTRGITLLMSSDSWDPKVQLSLPRLAETKKLQDKEEETSACLLA